MPEASDEPVPQAADNDPIRADLNPEELAQLSHAPLDSVQWVVWYRDFASRLKAFLLSVLRNGHQAEEALQATFAKALRQGGSVQPGKEQPWLFQVAFNEAMAIRRKVALDQRLREKLAEQNNSSSPQNSGGLQGKSSSSLREPAVDEELIRWETVQRVRHALSQLPVEQQVIVQRRIYEEQTFQQIATALNLPLGTTLTRMRLALQKLHSLLKDSPE